MERRENGTLESLFSDIMRLHRIRSMKIFGSLGMYRGQPAILFRLWERDGIPQKEIAEAIGVVPATVTIMLRRMEKAGWLERRADSADRRSSLVFLTEKGRAIRERLVEAKSRLNEACFRGFSDDERKALGMSFGRMLANLSEAGLDGEGK